VFKPKTLRQFLALEKLAIASKSEKLNTEHHREWSGALRSNLPKSFAKFRVDASFLLLECFLGS
jgi:hypothetical protein